MEGDHVNALLGQPGDSQWSDLLCLGAGGISVPVSACLPDDLCL